MLIRESRPRPQPWTEYRASHSRWSLPFHGLEYVFHWTAYALSHWAFLQVLEHVGSLSVLVAVIFYFAESGDRKKQKHYQAWQVINTAQGKGGSGGRIEALQELNIDREPLTGVDAAGAFLRGIHLHGASLMRCDLSGTDLMTSDFSSASFEHATLRSANFRSANLRAADFSGAILDDADLTEANLQNANLSGATLDDADLTNADLSGMKWKGIASINHAVIKDVRNAPAGFVDWALAHKAVKE